MSNSCCVIHCQLDVSQQRLTALAISEELFAVELHTQHVILSGRCTGNVDKCCNLMFFSRKLEVELQRTRYLESVTVK